MGRASSSSSSDSSSSSSSSDARRREKKRKREEKKHKHKRKSESKKRRKSDRADPDDPDRLEKKRLKEAKRFLKRQRRAADVALVPSAAAAKPKKSKTEKKKDEKKSPERPPAPLTAAQEAAARVAAARAAALAEDDALAHLGSSREDILGFRNGRNGADGVSGGGDNTKGDSKRFRRETAERLEDAVPKASGREALLEKRAAVRFSNREMADAKEDGMFSAAGWGEGNEMGGGSGDEFKAALASGRRAKDARDRRRGVDPSAVALRARAHRQGELQTMSGFHDLVGGLGEGERIQIPKRSSKKPRLPLFAAPAGWWLAVGSLRFESRVTNMASTATGTTADADFSGMGIYVDGRVKNELDDLLRTKNVTELTARDVHLISSMHYLDDQPMLKAAEFFELEKRDETDGGGGGGGGGENTASESDASSLHSKQPSSPKTILDFGAGFAGDARCLASEFQDTCVTCVEVQRHIHDAAEAFTTMLGLKDTCLHQCVDVFEDDDGDGENIEDGTPRNKIKIKGAPFDALYSVLVILHVPKRDRLWSVLSANLKPGASIYIEDYFALAPLSDLDKKKLQEVVACPYLPSKETYVKTLVENGFENIEWETMTSKWVPFIETRLSQFRAPENTERNLRVHGAALTKELDVFYSTVHELFTNGSVGGVRIRAKKAKF